MQQNTQTLIDQIKKDAITARKQHDMLTASTLQSLLARITNSEAVAAQKASDTKSGHIANASAGVGSTEAPRKELSVDDIKNIINDEINELKQATEHFSKDNTSPYLNELNKKILIATKYLT
ncbi:MAG: hypothetical protein PVI21_03805 [Candidatus Woesebacteria bacterium]|jgi:uncharacterized protein YqeY